MCKNRLVDGVESFKQFVVDEHNQLFEQYLAKEKEADLAKNEASLAKKSYCALKAKHQDLTDLSLKQTAEIERLNKSLNKLSNGNFGQAKIALLECQIMAMSASHADLISQNKNITAANEELIIKNAKLRSDRNNLIKDFVKVNNELGHVIVINEALIQFIDSLGYGVEVLPLPNPSKIVKEILKTLVELKYQVEEVKPTEKPERDLEKFNPEFLKDFHVEVIGGDSASQKAMKDLFGDLITDLKSKRNENRDNKGRYAPKQ